MYPIHSLIFQCMVVDVVAWSRNDLILFSLSIQNSFDSVHQPCCCTKINQFFAIQKVHFINLLSVAVYNLASVDSSLLDVALQKDSTQASQTFCCQVANLQKQCFKSNLGTPKVLTT